MDEDAITVVLVDDHRMFRAGVRASLDDAFDVVGAVSYTHLTLPTNREV